MPDNKPMPLTTTIPLPAAHALRKLGRDLALARRKRGISTADMAGRLFVSRDTLWRSQPPLCSNCMTGWPISRHRQLMVSPSAWTNGVCRNASAVPTHELGSSH